MVATQAMASMKTGGSCSIIKRSFSHAGDAICPAICHGLLG